MIVGIALWETKKATKAAWKAVEKADDANRIAIRSAKENIEELRKSAIESNRAWVKISINNSRIIIDDDFIHIFASFRVENIGNTTASNYTFSSDKYAISHGLIEKFERITADIGFMMRESYLSPIFPNDPILFERDFTISKRELTDAIEMYNSSVDPTDRIEADSPCVVTWVPYLLPGDKTVRHTVATFCIMDDKDCVVDFHPDAMSHGVRGGMSLKRYSMFSHVS